MPMSYRRDDDYAYSEGYRDGLRDAQRDIGRDFGRRPARRRRPQKPKKKRTTLSKWQKFVKTNSKKKEFRYRNGKVNLKKLGVAYRKKNKKR
jgi:hypothetical protein